MKIGILGMPFNGDGTRPELENSAAAFRGAGLTRSKLRSGDTLLDYGDLLIPVFDGHRDPSTKILNLNAWKEISRHTAKRLLSIQEEADTGEANRGLIAPRLTLSFPHSAMTADRNLQKSRAEDYPNLS